MYTLDIKPNITLSCCFSCSGLSFSPAGLWSFESCWTHEQWGTHVTLFEDISVWFWGADLLDWPVLTHGFVSAGRRAPALKKNSRKFQWKQNRMVLIRLFKQAEWALPVVTFNINVMFTKSWSVTVWITNWINRSLGSPQRCMTYVFAGL